MDNEKMIENLKELLGDSVVFHEGKGDFGEVAKASSELFTQWLSACGYNDDILKQFALHSKDSFSILVDSDKDVVRVGAIGSFPDRDGGLVEVGIGIPLQFELKMGAELKKAEPFLDAVLILFHLAKKLDTLVASTVYVEKVKEFSKKYFSE